MRGKFHRPGLIGWLMTCSALLAVSAHGQVFLSNENYNTVSEYSLSGALMNSSLISGLDEPIGLAVVGNDLFVVNNFSGSIAEYTTSGTLVNAHFATGLNSPSELVAEDGALYVATFSTSAGNEIMKISGGTTSLFAKLGSDSNGSIGGMAFDSQGNLFATLDTAADIKKISPNGSSITTFAASGPDFNLTSPLGLAFDASGNLYVLDSATDQVKWYSADGTYMGVFASGNLDQPGSMAFDSLGNLYVANQGTSDVEEFSPTGSDLGVFADPGQGAIGDIVIVPEPSTLVLLSLGVAAFGARLRELRRGRRG
jgi:streptogramin lyase